MRARAIACARAPLWLAKHPCPCKGAMGHCFGPFHTERATSAPALMCGRAQTNFYCFQRSLSHGVDTGHCPHTGNMQCWLHLGLSRAHTCEKVLCNIASNGCLHTEREKPALTDSFNDTQRKLAIKTGDKNKYATAYGGFSLRHVKRSN